MNVAMSSHQKSGNQADSPYDTPNYSNRSISPTPPSNHKDQYPHAYSDQSHIGAQRQDFQNTQRSHGQQPSEPPSTDALREARDGPSENTRELPVRERPRVNAAANSKPQRICASCGQSLTGQFVRAIGGTFHLECFRCRVRLNGL